MKQLNITFEDEAFEEIESLKNYFDLNWRDFILLLVKHVKESIKKGYLKRIKKEEK